MLISHGNRSGGLLSSLLFGIVFFLIFAGIWFWYQNGFDPHFFNGGKAKGDKPYVAYEDYVKNQERKKAIDDFKKKWENLLGKIFHRPN